MIREIDSGSNERERVIFIEHEKNSYGIYHNSVIFSLSKATFMAHENV
jgi:hypothetical protein